LKWLRGENRGPEDRAGGLIRDPQPGHLLPGGQRQLLDRIHLPDLVRHPAARRGFGPGPAGWGGGAAEATQPTLHGTPTGQRLAGAALRQLDEEAAGTPAGPLRVQLPEHRQQRGRRRGLVAAAGAVGRQQRGAAALVKVAEEDADRTGGQAQQLGDVGGGAALTG
jgi:hypothetical protein